MAVSSWNAGINSENRVRKHGESSRHENLRFAVLAFCCIKHLSLLDGVPSLGLTAQA